MKQYFQTRIARTMAISLLGLLPLAADAKNYSSGGKSYSSSRSSSSPSRSSSFGSSSSSSRSSGSGKSYTSGSGRTYSSGAATPSSSKSSSASSSSVARSSRSDSASGNSSALTSRRDSRPVPTAPSSAANSAADRGRTYSSGAGGKSFSTSASEPNETGAKSPASKDSSFSFDTAAAQASKQAASKRDFEESKRSRSASDATAPDRTTRRVNPFGGSYSGSPPPPVLNPTREIWVSRPERVRRVYEPYYSRPIVVYNDNYSSFFWWWLLDRSIEDRALWAYSHRASMDAARYQALMASDANLEARVRALETQRAPVGSNYVPPGIDRDLMYDDRYVQRAYAIRPTTSGRIAFWVILVPTAVGMTWFLIWLVFYKRWQTVK